MDAVGHSLDNLDDAQVVSERRRDELSTQPRSVPEWPPDEVNEANRLPVIGSARSSRVGSTGYTISGTTRRNASVDAAGPSFKSLLQSNTQSSIGDVFSKGENGYPQLEPPSKTASLVVGGLSSPWYGLDRLPRQ